MDAHTEKSPNT